MNIKGNNVDIMQDDKNKARVFIDGKELKCISKVNYSNDIQGLPKITVEFTPATLNFKDTEELYMDGQK